MSSLTRQTSDGQRLAADLAEPTGDLRGRVVLCHPHPLYGGGAAAAVAERTVAWLGQISPATG